MDTPNDLKFFLEQNFLILFDVFFNILLSRTSNILEYTLYIMITLYVYDVYLLRDLEQCGLSH